MKGEKIKVHISFDSQEEVAGETLWAEYLGDNKAKLLNTPFFTTEMSWGDIVRIEETDSYPEVVEIIQKYGKSVLLTFELIGESKPLECAVCGENKEHKYHPDDIKRWKQICKYFDSLGGLVFGRESAILGHFSINVPLNINKEKIQEICNNCPVELHISDSLD